MKHAVDRYIYQTRRNGRDQLKNIPATPVEKKKFL